MGTKLNEVYDYFALTVTDYRLTQLFNESQEDYENFLQAWLEFAIAEFSMCDQDLEFNDETKEFNVVLSRENKVVLATLMMKYWLQKLVNDITQMNLHVQDRDFRVASEAMNLREKATRLTHVKETCSQMLLDYEYKRNNWSNWTKQKFSGG